LTASVSDGSGRSARDQEFLALLSEAQARLRMSPPPDETLRRSSIIRVGCFELSLTEAQLSGSEIPPLWIELFDHCAGTSLDGAGFHDLGEGVQLVARFVEEAQRRDGRE
jgi:hypothetical protein